jgi:hypothetical protein
MNTIDYLIHIYRRGNKPFRSLSALPDKQAIDLMRSMYVDGSVFWERFKDPFDYLQARRQTEQWLRQEFIAKGGAPQMPYPIYFIFGWTKWLTTGADETTLATTTNLQVPLALFGEDDVSFTYPDSMITLWLASEKVERVYLPEFHGRVFTLREMQAIVQANGLPGERWGYLPAEVPNYIEAQVWNQAPLVEYQRITEGTSSEPE